MNDAAWLLWVVPLVAAPLVVGVARVAPGLRGWFALGASGIAFALSLAVGLTYTAPSTESLGLWLPYLHLALQVRVDGLSTLVSIFVSFLSLLVVVYSLGYMEKEGGARNLTRYYSLVLAFIGGMLGLVMAGNLIQFYLFWEVVGICSALLIGFWSDRESARRAGLKAFAVTRLGDSALLIAVILILTTVGSTSFETVLGPAGTSALTGGSALLVGALILVGAMGKSAQVPLHVWLPDAMEGPTPVSALIHAATMVNAGVYLLVRMSPLFQTSQVLLDSILVVGLLSAAVGAVNAVAEEDLKRILAYSTISQLGFMFVAVGLASPLAATYQMMSQGFFKALAFMAAGSIVTAVGTRNIERMGGLRRAMKYTFVGFALSILAMSGLPPLIGFWSKDAIVSIALGSNAAEAVALLLVSVVTALYGFRPLIKVFFGEPKAGQGARESPPSMVVPISVLSVTVAVVWLVLERQSLLPLASLGTPDAVTIVSSLGVLLAGALSAYLAFSRYPSRTALAVTESRFLSGLRNLLLEGLGFDSAYLAIANRVLLPLSGLSRRLQTGRLGTNTSLMVAALVVLIVLIALGVV